MNAQEGDYDVCGDSPNPSFTGRAEDEEFGDNIGATSGDNIGATSGDNIGATSGDNDQDGGQTGTIQRHSHEKIEQLENFFRKCQHPSEEEKSELGRRLNLETRQIRFWFQNKRTQARMYQERHESRDLRQENAILRGEQELLKKEFELCSCNACGGPINVDVMQQLTDENTRLKQELACATSLHRVPIQSPVDSPSAAAQHPSSLMMYNPGRNAPPELGSGGVTSIMDELSTVFTSPSARQPSSSLMMPNPGTNAPPKLGPGGETSMMNEWSTFSASPSAAQPYSSELMSIPGINAPPGLGSGGGTSTVNERSTFLASPGRNAPPPELGPRGVNKRSLLELATVAMDELIMLGQTNSPFWRLDSSSKRETLNYWEYRSFFNDGITRPPGYVVEASRATSLVPMDSLALVKTFTTNKWVNVFAPIVSVASTQKLIPTGSAGPKSGSLRLIKAEFQVISPLVAKRKVKFLRYCKYIRDGVWVVVDFTPRLENMNLLSDGDSTRLPSGVIIKDMNDGSGPCSSQVTWIEQTEYDESHIPQLYKLLIGSGMGLGAKRWLTTLQRHCENISTLSSINLAQVYLGLSSKGATEMVKLAHRMTLSYYSGITSCSARRWKRINVEYEGQSEQKILLMTRKNVNLRGEHTGVVLSAATSVWFPVSQQTVFDFLSNQSLRDQWDVLTNYACIEEKILIEKSRRQSNYVSLLQVADGVLVLQETWNDSSGALLVYAPVEKDSMDAIMRGEDSDYANILPSGFSILPDGGESETGGGCVLTLGFQILVNSKPTTEINQRLVQLMGELLASTIDKTKSALSIQTY